MNRNQPKLNDFFPGWVDPLISGQSNAGIFLYLGGVDSLNGLPWYNNNTYDNPLVYSYNLLYHTHSGDKLASPFLTKIASRYPPQFPGELISEPGRIVVGRAIAHMFFNNWNKLWSTLELSYNPIHNYDVEAKLSENTVSNKEVKSDNTTRRDDTHSQTVNNTDRYTGSDITTHTGTDVTDSSVGEKNGSESISVNKSGSEKVSETGTDTTTTTHAQEHVIEEVTHPAGEAWTETTIQNGSERVAEKGGTITKTWAFDSPSPVPTEMTIARGGEGSGSGGDGTSEGDGHVTETSYADRKTETQTTGTRTTTTDRYWGSSDSPSQDVVERSPNLDRVTTYDAYLETHDKDWNEQAHSDTDTRTLNLSDTLQHGKIVSHEGDLSGTDTRDITVKGTDTTSDTTDSTQDDKRSGLSGQYTPQMMLEQEYELRKKQFLAQVFKDLDSILTLPIY